jgi:hypothetical protein
VRLFVKKYPQYQIFNLDALTYAGNLENIVDIEKEPNYTFVKGILLMLPLLMLCLLNINLMGFAFGCGVACRSFHYRSFIFVKQMLLGQ